MYCPLIKRIRSKNQVEYIDATLVRYYRGNVVLDTSVPFYFGPHNTILDEVVNWSEATPGSCGLEYNKKIFKEVTNSAVSFDDVAPDVTNTIQLNYPGSPNHYVYHFQNGYVLHWLSDKGAFAPSLDAYSPIVLKEAFEKLLPSFKDAKVDQFNVYTAVLELADLRKTFTKTALKLNHPDFISNAAEKNLLINFGVLPLFGDIQTIYNIITRLSGYIDRWNKAAKAGLTWDKHGVLYPSQLQHNRSVDFGYYSTITGKVTWSVDSQFDGSAVSKIHLYFKPKLIPRNMRSRVFQRALGLDKPLAGAWEAVPFSWAIDYFLNVGEFIDAYDEAIETMFQYEYVSSGYSVTKMGTTTFTVTPNDNGDSTYVVTTMPEGFTRTLTEHTYFRKRLSSKAIFDYIAKPDKLALQNKAGLWQTSYLASVAWLRSRK